MFQKLANYEGVGPQGLDDLTWNDPPETMENVTELAIPKIKFHVT